MGKRILIFTNHYYPETFRVNDVSFYLAEKGHKVTVVTGIPDYPKGEYYEGYGVFKRRSETINGVKIYRTYIFPRGKGGALRLMLNYLTQMISQILWAFWLALFGKYDCVIVHETSPVMVGIPGVIVKKIKKIPFYFWVLDLWPESLSAAGGINNPKILGIFDKMTRWLYRNSDKILISSNGFRKSIEEKGDFADKIEYFPNWGESVFEQRTSSPADLPSLPEGYRIMFAGNIGEAQNFENVMQVALRLKDTPVRWILIGNGRKREWIETFVREHGLEQNVFMPGQFPIDYMPAFFAQADAMFFSLKSDPIFSLTLPAKIQAYMASHKPILAMISGEGADVIAESDCGYSTPADDIDGMSSVIRDKVLAQKEQFATKGENGFVYFKTHFDREKCLTHLEEILKV